MRAADAEVAIVAEERDLFEAAMRGETMEGAPAAPARAEPRHSELPRAKAKKIPKDRINAPFAAMKDELTEMRRELEQVDEARQRGEEARRVEERAREVEERAIAKEGETFAQAMSGVRLLPGDGRVGASRGPAKPRPAVDDEAEVMAELADLVGGLSSFDTVFSHEHIEGISEGIDRRLLKKLRKGDFSVGAHLDLHGLTRLEAKPKVEAFLLDSRRRHHRCVLIVHGRGLHSKEGVPVLKKAVGTWLMGGRNARSVLAFCSARSSDGGLGAIYVLLRR